MTSRRFVFHPKPISSDTVGCFSGGRNTTVRGFAKMAPLNYFFDSSLRDVFIALACRLSRRRRQSDYRRFSDRSRNWLRSSNSSNQIELVALEQQVLMPVTAASLQLHAMTGKLIRRSLTPRAHIAQLRWQTILPPPLKPAEIYCRLPRDIKDPYLRGEGHSSTMFVYAGMRSNP